MAIYHMSAQVVSRSAGRSAVAAAAYRAGTELVDERTGLVHDYSRKHGVEHTEICMPDGCTWQPNRQELWSAVEIKNKRQDSVVAREIRLALPHELDAGQRKELVQEFAHAIANRYNIAVDVAVHAPDKEGDDRNHHAHLLITTNTIKGDGLGNKCREMDKVACDKSSQQNSIESLREQWATLANEHLARAGREERIDHRSYKEQGIDLTPTQHLGPNVVAMERRGIATDRMAEHEEIRKQQAAEIINRPEILAEKITGMRATFSANDIAKELNRYVDDPQQFQGVMARALASNDLVQLAPKTADGPAVYTTREMVDVERQMIKSARTLANPVASRGTHSVAAKLVDQAIERAGTMSEEQANAVRHVCGKERLAVIVGDAGTGKSFSMRTAAAAWQAAGYNVRGAALAGKAADELQAGSGINSRTLASLEYAWKKGRDKLTPKDVLVIDEAGMVGSRQMGRVLEAAEKAGAKVVLLGDHKQLAAIEAGSAFRAITERVGAAEITEVRRQSQKWMKEAGQELARGSVEKAVAAYQEHGLIKSAETREQARADLARKYVADLEKGGSCIVLSHTNKDVTALNESIREERKGRGELANGVTVETERGMREFAEGDRLVFLKNDKDLGVKNGTLATVEKAEAGMLHVRLDDGSERDVDMASYKNVEHGYAVTVHKAQGVTVDRAYLLATPSMDRSLAYVGMTRHRHECEIYHGQDDFKSPGDMTKAMSRADNKTSTLDYLESRAKEQQHGERGVRREHSRSDQRDSAGHGIRAGEREARERAAELAISPGEIEAADMDCVRELPARDLAGDGQPMGSTLRDHAHASGQQREHEQERDSVPGDETMARPAQPGAAERLSQDQQAEAEAQREADRAEAREQARQARLEQQQQERQAREQRIAAMEQAQAKPQEPARPQAQAQELSSVERWEQQRAAVEAKEQRDKLIEQTAHAIKKATEKALREAREQAEQAVADMGKRPGTGPFGMGKSKQAEWDGEMANRQAALNEATRREDQFNNPRGPSESARQAEEIRRQAKEQVDRDNPDLARQARQGARILSDEQYEKRQEQIERNRARKERERENERGGRSR